MSHLRKMMLSASMVSFLSNAAVLEAAEPIYHVEDASWIESRMEYPYFEGSIYEVDTQLGFATDINLHPGDILQGIVGGDTSRWQVDTATIGNTCHVFLKPVKEGLHTNLVIYTNRRVYHVLLSSAKGTYQPIVSWRYPEEAQRIKEEQKVSEEERSFDEIFTKMVNGQRVIKTINRMYEMKGKRVDKDNYPVEVFDDGTRTYIRMPESNKYDLPVIYRVNDKDKHKLTLVNYRVRHGYFIIDRVFDHARLQFSAKEYIDIQPMKREKVD